MPGRVRTLAWLRWRSADTRMRAAFATLDAAELAGRPPRELDLLSARFEQASSACAAAEVVLRRLDATHERCASAARALPIREHKHVMNKRPSNVLADRTAATDPVLRIPSDQSQDITTCFESSNEESFGSGNGLALCGQEL